MQNWCLCETIKGVSKTRRRKRRCCVKGGGGGGKLRGRTRRMTAACCVKGGGGIQRRKLRRRRKIAKITWLELTGYRPGVVTSSLLCHFPPPKSGKYAPAIFRRRRRLLHSNAASAAASAAAFYQPPTINRSTSKASWILKYVENFFNIICDFLLMGALFMHILHDKKIEQPIEKLSESFLDLSLNWASV